MIDTLPLRGRAFAAVTVNVPKGESEDVVGDVPVTLVRMAISQVDVMVEGKPLGRYATGLFIDEHELGDSIGRAKARYDELVAAVPADLNAEVMQFAYLHDWPTLGRVEGDEVEEFRGRYRVPGHFGCLFVKGSSNGSITVVRRSRPEPGTPDPDSVVAAFLDEAERGEF